MFNQPLLSVGCFLLKSLIFVFLSMAFMQGLQAQDSPSEMDLDEVLGYAFSHNPLLEQYKNQKEIAGYETKSANSGWLPQVGVMSDYIQYFEQPVAIFPDFDDPQSGEFQEVRTGVPYNASAVFSANQALFNNELFRAKAQAPDIRKEADQSLEELKIELAIQVSTAFYEVLLAQEQVNLTKEDLNRQEKQLQDAKLLFEAGLTDQIDYKRALITLQNTRSALYQFEQDIEISTARLKELMGMKEQEELSVKVTYEELMEEVYTDTLQQLTPSDRIEYSLLDTRKSLQESELRFQKRNFIPQLSAFFDYNFLYLGPVSSLLFDQTYTFSLVGLRLNYPIFQGGKRNYDTRAAALRLRNLELAQDEVVNIISREHQEALSTYKKQLYQLNIQESNKQLAEEIYQVVSLQYEEGIKNFLEVIVAETDLRTSRINYYRSLFGVLTSKLALQKARGELTIDY